MLPFQACLCFMSIQLSWTPGCTKPPREWLQLPAACLHNSSLLFLTSVRRGDTLFPEIKQITLILNLLQSQDNNSLFFNHVLNHFGWTFVCMLFLFKEQSSFGFTRGLGILSSPPSLTKYIQKKKKSKSEDCITIC